MILNLTPHKIVFRPASGPDREFPPSGALARVVMQERPADPADGLPCIRREAGDVIIPETDVVGPVYYLVSSMVLEAARERRHPALSRLLAPDTGPTAIREAGQVAAVTRFVCA